MNRILLTAIAVLLVSSSFAVARDRHHHHHVGSHYHRSHGSHYGLHSYSHRSHYGHSGFSFALSLGRSYGYSYPRSYGYSYPSRYRYYSTPSYYSSRSYYVTPSYRSYGYSYPSCEVQSVPVQPRSGVIVPQAQPAKKKVEPTPQAVPIAPPPPPAPNAVAPTTRGVSVASHRRAQPQVVTNGGGNSLQVKSKSSTALGPQLSATAGRTLISDESVPFVVPINEPAPVAATGPLFSPVTTPADRSETEVTSPISIPQAMRGIALLSVADQKLALVQRTCLVTGDLLGSDGKPVKIQLRGQTVFVCCQECANEVRANPNEFVTAR